MKLKNLIVTQEEVRPTITLPPMIQFVRDGGFWTLEALLRYASLHGQRLSPLIQLSRFEDGLLYIHDGHHRCVSTHLGGRDHLLESEYVVTDWTYDQYLEVNFANGWYTPFDPRTQVRVADIRPFKGLVRKKLKELEDGVAPFTSEGLESIIRQLTHKYARPRKFYSVADLAAAWRDGDPA